MHAEFYDIESLENVFTCTSWYPDKKKVKVYVIDDNDLLQGGAEWHEQHAKRTLAECAPEANKAVVKAIIDANPRMMELLDGKQPSIEIIDIKNIDGLADFLNEFCVMMPSYMSKGMVLAHTFAYSQEDTTGKDIRKNYPDMTISDNARILGIKSDTDSDFDEENIDTPYILGYNSSNYDSTMLAYVVWNLFARSATQQKTNVSKNDINTAVTATSIRRFNNLLFSQYVRSNMADGAKLIADYADAKEMEYIKSSQQKEAIKAISKYIIDNENDVPTLNLGDGFLSSTGLSNLRQATMSTGRHIDVARLNEKQRKVALKRLLGMIGAQILESDKLHGENTKLKNQTEMLELVAYNVSDVVGTQLLFGNNVYKSGFDLKRNMLKTYPELVWDTDTKALEKAMKGDMTPEEARKESTKHLGKTGVVSRRRLFSDASSQNLASKALSPIEPLIDKPTVSLMYPDPSKADNLEQVRDVLEQSKKFFETEVLPLIQDQADHDEAQENFMHVYRAYRRIIGNNFDASKKYNECYKEIGPIASISQVAADLPWSMPYYDGQGHKTSCFATFSTGGLHGAELNVDLYQRDLAEYQAIDRVLSLAKEQFGDTEEGAVALRNSVKRLADPVPLKGLKEDEEYFVKDFLKSGFTKSKASWKVIKAPELFTETKVKVQAVDKDGHRIWQMRGKKDTKHEFLELDDLDVIFLRNGQLIIHRVPNEAAMQILVQKYKDGKCQIDQDTHMPYIIRDGITYTDFVTVMSKNNQPIDICVPRAVSEIANQEYKSIDYQEDKSNSTSAQTLYKYLIKVNKGDNTPIGYLRRTCAEHNMSTKKPEEPGYNPDEPGFEEVMVPSAKNELRKRYVYTSAAYVNHEDFSSYYPGLLRQMNAFFNKMLGYDRYGEIYLDKERFGKMMKDPSRSKEERERLSLDRNGVKLILNTASGAGDAKFDNNIRMNNNIIAMRLIGQLFTWRIGQAQALKGASVPSTNTDGLYTVMEEKQNNKLLFEVADAMGVAIEPEVMHLVSKDANNRIEFAIEPTTPENAPVIHPSRLQNDNTTNDTHHDNKAYGYAWFRVLDDDGNPLPEKEIRWVPEPEEITNAKAKIEKQIAETTERKQQIENDIEICKETGTDYTGPSPEDIVIPEPYKVPQTLHQFQILPAKFKVLSASGGDLACRRGPDVSKSLAHPALIDWALSEYLMRTYLRNDCTQKALSAPFDKKLATQIVKEAQEAGDVHALLLFQNVLASNPSSLNFIFAEDKDPKLVGQDETDDFEDGEEPIVLQHYNRTFIMDKASLDEKELETHHLWSAVGKTVSARDQKRRQGLGQPTYLLKSRTAFYVLTQNISITNPMRPAESIGRDIVRQKVNRVDPKWNMLIENNDLFVMSEKRRKLILKHLNIDAYVSLVRDAYVKNWQNN